MESVEKLDKFPVAAIFIIVAQTSERISFYGMRGILSIYIRNYLQFTEKSATVIVHCMLFVMYLLPVFGAIMADSWLGKFKVIFYLIIIYTIGSVILTFSSVPGIHMPTVEGSIIGLFITAIGSGGIKPCVISFGGDQFILPEQEKKLTLFFSVLYFTVNFGTIITMLVTPILRTFHCFGESSCYALSFGLSTILMFIATTVFIFGKPLYTIKTPSGNAVTAVCKCIGNAIKNKITRDPDDVRDHWLDYASDTYETKLVEDTKLTLRILFLYIPLPLFWALFDQQVTTWTFQASRCNGNIGFYTILPEQCQLMNPLIVICLIPTFEMGVYPLANKLHLFRTRLQRMVVGGCLAATAFIISGVLELQLEKTYPILPSVGEAQIRVYNGLSCNLVVTELETKAVHIRPHGFHAFYFSFDEGKTYSVHYTVTATNCHEFTSVKIEEELPEKYMAGHVMLTGSKVLKYEDDIDKSITGYPAIRTIVEDSHGIHKLVYKSNAYGDIELDTSEETFANPLSLDPGIWSLEVDDKEIGKTEFLLGGVYFVVANIKNQKLTSTEVTPPNSIHMLWILPQYLLLTSGEIMFVVTGNDFAYTQAPISLKSVMQAGWLLTISIGNALIVILENIIYFERHSIQIFLYAALMIVDMIIFSFMAMGYTYVQLQT